MIEIKKGLDLPIVGGPSQEIDKSRPVSRVAVVGPDYHGLKPTMLVREGDSVKLGQVLFRDKATPGVQFTAPGSGNVVAVNRGEKRRFLSVEIELGGEEEVTFEALGDRHPSALSREEVTETLVQSGLWTAFRTRPYSRVPTPGSQPSSIFVTAIDTNPLSLAPEPLIADEFANFERGILLLKQLTEGIVFVCVHQQGATSELNEERVQVEPFSGPHPAGLAGTHIHHLDPVGPSKTVWTINFQDVIGFGKLFATGRLSVERVISLAGPSVLNPRLLRTRVGACIEELVVDEVESGARIISGSVLSGRAAVGPLGYLGRYHWQVSALAEGDHRVFLEWMLPGANRYSTKKVFWSAFRRGARRFEFTTSREGSRRAMVPIGMYEKVMPLDILPTSLLRALIVGDTEQAQGLGCLELDEEDLALCTFVCPGKYEYGPMLRDCLRRIEEEG